MPRRVLLAAVVLLTAACSGGGGSPSSSPNGQTVTGSFVLAAGDGSNFDSTGAECHGATGYDDITAGLDVTAKDQDGTIIGTGKLSTGKVEKEFVNGQFSAKVTACKFTFRLTALPEATFYTFQVGRRGELTYSKAEMEAASWTVAFTLGS